MSTQNPDNLIVFINEEYSYRCYVMILQGVTDNDVYQWWREKKGAYHEPLPGEVRRSDIIWKRDMEPEAGWTPVEESWPQVDDVFHLLDREANSYDPAEYVMVEGAIFVHVHMDEDSFLRDSNGQHRLHPDYDAANDNTDEVDVHPSGMMAWGVTTTRTEHFPTFNNERTGDGGTE